MPMAAQAKIQNGGTAEKPKENEPAVTAAGEGGEGSYNSGVKTNAKIRSAALVLKRIGRYIRDLSG